MSASMRKNKRRAGTRAASCAICLLLLHAVAPPLSMAYVINSVVADMRQSAAESGGTACPLPTRFNASLAGGISRQWSTSLGSPATILTQDQTPGGQINEIAATIAQSFAIWTGVNGSALTPASLGSLNATTGAVAAAVISGWSCSDPGPAVFDGTYTIAGLAVGPQQAYEVYAEPLDGPVSPATVLAQTVLCRNSATDPGWLAQFACTTPAPITNFSARIRPAP
jgi:hypothetical protein